MSVLALDTSSTSTVVGLLRSDGALFAAADRRGPGERAGHQERMLPLAAELLERAQLELAAIDSIAVGIGPGTFTGLRVGIATARALAQALGCAIVPVGSLRALALSAAVELRESAGAEGLVALTLTDARRGELFAAAYLCADAALGQTPRELLAPRAIAPGAIAAMIAQARAQAGSAALVAVGDGAGIVAAELAHGGVSVPPSTSAAHLIDGGALARLGALGEPEAIVAVAPDYCRAPDAEATAGPRGGVRAGVPA